jgi:hypothetical protein
MRAKDQKVANQKAKSTWHHLGGGKKNLKRRAHDLKKIIYTTPTHPHPRRKIVNTYLLE